jgi:hypothetical protein
MVSLDAEQRACSCAEMIPGGDRRGAAGVGWREAVVLARRADGRLASVRRVLIRDVRERLRWVERPDRP